MLSHDFRSNVTSAFCKGTPASDIEKAISFLKRCGQDAQHPLLSPVIMIGNDASFETDIKQRDARDWLRKIEHSTSMRSNGQHSKEYVDLDTVSRHLVECHAQVLWKQPIAFLRLIDLFKEALDIVYDNLTLETRTLEMQKIHEEIRSRMEFYKRKWEGIETYANTTLERIETQKNLVRDQHFGLLVVTGERLIVGFISSSTISLPRRRVS